jgi:hypothetical protein
MGDSAGHADAALHLLCADRGWRSQRLNDQLYLFESRTDTLLRVDNSLIPPLLGSTRGASLADSLAEVAARRSDPSSSSQPVANADEHVVSLSLLGVRVDVRCVHQACADGIAGYFSAVHEPAPIASPEAIVWCSWPSAERYLFRAREDSTDGEPLDGVEVQTLDRPRGPWTSSQQPLPPLVDLPFRDRFVALHAAVLRPSNGGGLLVAGERGAGKTTAALSMANEHGAQLLADETAFVHCRTRTVEPFPHAVGVWREGRKSQIPVTDVCRSVSREPVELSQLVFLTRRSGPAAVEDLQPEETLRHLLPHHRHGGADAGSAMATLFRLAADVKASIVSYSDYRDLGALIAPICA